VNNKISIKEPFTVVYQRSLIILLSTIPENPSNSKNQELMLSSIFFTASLSLINEL
jgi:hypothetical protein